MEMMSMKTLNTSALVTADSPKGQRATETFRRFSTKAPDYSLAQSILGADFITPEEITKVRPSIVYTVEQIMALAESLPSEDVLKWCKDNGYAVMPAPPTAMSTLDVREIQSAHFYSETGGWYSDQKFAREDKTSFGWLLIKKTPVSNSTSKTWGEQNKLLSALEKVPNVAEMSWFITTYFEVRGVRLFEGVYVRTSSCDSDGRYVCVGRFDEGLHVDSYWDDSHDNSLGLSAAWKQ
ncbi:MAG: hypothetical protein WC666_00095 [Candidatus Paceibacterota bacterium]|jgi:hypothetical protein